MKTKRKTSPITLPDGLVMGTNIHRQAPAWLWDNYLPLNALCSLEGEKGKGKGTFIYHLMSRVTTGTPMPLEQTSARRAPAACILYTAEDHLKIVVKPKLDAAGADPKLYAVRGVNALLRITADTTPLINDIDRMQQVTGKTVRLVAIDPLSAILGTSIYNPQAFRVTANALMDVAEQMGVTLLCTRHQTKSGSGKLLNRGLGGVEVTNVQRAVNALMEVPVPLTTPADDNSTRLFVPVVCNYVPPQPILRVQLTSTALTVNGARKLFATMKWLGVSALTLADLAQKSKATPQTDTARKILTNMLASGERDSDAVLEAAKAAGVSEKTVRIVAKEMGVIHEQHSRRTNGSKPASYWTMRLPEKHDDKEAAA